MSFNRAAERLNYAQSSVSAQIQTLEYELGVQLFDRLGRRILLTEADKLLAYAEKILRLADKTRPELADEREPQGSPPVRIPETCGTLYLSAVIRVFHTRFPKVQLRFITCAHKGLQKDLRKSSNDLAFLFAESIQSADLNGKFWGSHQWCSWQAAIIDWQRRPKYRPAIWQGKHFFFPRRNAATEEFSSKFSISIMCHEKIASNLQC